jgi:lipoprotein-releasing system ATP-binding protein
LESVVLETVGLTKNFQTAGGELRVLKGIDLQINEGDFVSISGPSGVGKSTLLHILGGLDKPTAGTVTAAGNRIDQLTDLELSRYRNKMIGFVFQFHYLLEEFNALENVMMPLLVRGESRNKSAEKAVKFLREVGLAERVSHRPAQLSGGERQRVAVARAMAGSPELLIADEPTGDLDIDTAAGLHDLLEELNRTRAMTIVVATHDQSLSKRASRRFVMTDGHLESRN